MLGRWKTDQDLMGASRRHAPSKARKPRIIAIESDPLTAGLHGQGSKPCVRHQVASGFRFRAKAREDLPVPLARLNDHAAGLSQQDVTESEHLIHAARFHKDLRVGGDADHTAQYLWSHTVTRVAVDHAIEPGPASPMLG